MTTLPRARALLALLILTATGLLAGCSAAGSPSALLPVPPAAEPASAAGLTQADVDAWLDGRVPAALEDGGIPGAVVTVVHDGEILTARGYGDAVEATPQSPAVPVDAGSTLFRVGSVSKLVTDIAVLQQVEQGRLDLDADISEYVDVPIERRFDGDITLRTLLTHTAGFEERLTGMILPEGTPTELEDYVLTDPPVQVYAPGTTPAYSNYGLSLAGYIVQETTGVPFDRYVQENVLDRAGTDTATFAQPLPEGAAADLAAGYTASGTPANGFEVVAAAPAGALSASGTDMGMLMLALLGEGSGQPLLGEEMRQQMQEPALDDSTLGNLAAGQRMGLGWFDETRNGHRVLGHGGDTQFFHSALEIYPDDATGIFLSTNATGDDASAYTLREQLLDGFSDRYFPAADDDPATAPAADPGAVERAATVAGAYESTRSMASGYMDVATLLSSARITAVGDGRILVSGVSTGGPMTYTEVAPWVWREDGGHRLLAAEVQDGRVVRIGHDSAMSIVPVGAARGSLLPVLAISALVLALLVIAGPMGALRRRLRSALGTRSAASAPPLGAWGIAARIAGAAALAALIGWVLAVGAAASFHELPTAAIRGIQVLQLIGIIGLVPAAADLVRATARVVRGEAEAVRAARVLAAGRVLAALLLLLALGGVLWSAAGLHLLSLDMTV